MDSLLTDTFGRRHDYLRISLTERCNLRCQYCMPEEGVALSPRDHILTFEEIVRLARHFVAAGVTKIRLTGGEPLVRKNVEELVDAIGAIDGLETLAITTNGLLLPKKLDRLVAGGVNLVNISLDSLQTERFRRIARRDGLDIVRRAIDLALEAGVRTKVNCVVMKGVNDDELVDFVSLTQNLPIEVRFIEFMPFAGNMWNDAEFMPFDAMMERIRVTYPGLRRLEDGPNDTSKAFAVPGFAGRVGFITSMTQEFCSTCNRLRITADGNLKVCLFGNAEVSLRDAMRDGATDGELSELIGSAVNRKKAAHAGLYNLVTMDNRPMILIGG
ncbi:MAG: GTP 3',8-cyclase MoaA [Bacteroidetes bacterium]|nr:GTP 3',8-cyclase MoaA [Bacteroidota bacterium]